MTAKFKFYEIVFVQNTSSKESVRGYEGAIMGMVESDSGEWFYSVHMYALGESWYFPENELGTTGRMDSRNSFYGNNSTIRVSVDPVTLEGKIITD